MVSELLTLHPRWETEFINLTTEIREFVRQHKIMNDILVLKSQHTTAGLIINEFEEGMLNDLLRHAELVVPKTAYYEHDDTSKRKVPQPDERKNGWSHIRAVLYSQPQLTIPIINGELGLGKYQSIIFCDWDGHMRPERHVLITSLMPD